MLIIDQIIFNLNLSYWLLTFIQNYYFHFSDKDEEMAEFSKSILQKTLNVKYPDFFAQHFSECLLVMNGCTGTYLRYYGYGIVFAYSILFDKMIFRCDTTNFAIFFYFIKRIRCNVASI